MSPAPRWHPASCDPPGSEEKDRLKRRKNRLQLSCDLHGLKFLQLLSVQDRHELREKNLLCLCHLLLQGVDFNHQYANLCRVTPRIQQIPELLDERLGRLKQRHKCSLARLQQFSSALTWPGCSCRNSATTCKGDVSWALG